MEYLRKYATATHVYIPIVKRAVVDFALSADWTPAAGDVKISIDGGAAANVANLPTAITMGNGAMWDFSLTSGETTGKKINVTVVDAATKAVEDQMFSIITFGNASAEYVVDFADGVHFGLSALPNTAVTTNASLITSGTGTDQLQVTAGLASANAKQINAVSTSPVTTVNANQGTTQPVNFTGTAGSALVKGDMVDVAGAAVSTSVAQIGTNVVSIAANAMNASALATDAVTEIAAGVWNEPISGHLTAGSTGAALNAAGSSGDPWVTPLPGAYGAGSAGNIVGNRVDATVSSRLAASSYTAPDNTDIVAIKAKTDTLPAAPADQTTSLAIKAKTDNLPASPAAVGSPMTLAAGERDAVADAHIARNIKGGSSAGRTVGQVYAVSRNKVVIAGGTLTVYDVDDTTVLWTATVTTAAGNPLSSVDPA